MAQIQTTREERDKRSGDSFIIGRVCLFTDYSFTLLLFDDDLFREHFDLRYLSFFVYPLHSGSIEQGLSLSSSIALILVVGE